MRPKIENLTLDELAEDFLTFTLRGLEWQAPIMTINTANGC